LGLSGSSPSAEFLIASAVPICQISDSI
jgi:hypothetical protein